MLSDDALARNLSALAHPRRSMIFRLLIRQPEAGNSLGTLVAATGLRQSSAVHHLREMERCGVITRRRKGVHMSYRLSPGEFTAALATALRMSDAARAAVSRAS